MSVPFWLWLWIAISLWSFIPYSLPSAGEEKKCSWKIQFIKTCYFSAMKLHYLFKRGVPYCPWLRQRKVCGVNLGRSRFSDLSIPEVCPVTCICPFNQRMGGEEIGNMARWDNSRWVHLLVLRVVRRDSGDNIGYFNTYSFW